MTSMSRFLICLAFAIPTLIGTSAQAAEDPMWPHTTEEINETLSKSEGDDIDSKEQEDDSDWRLYLDLYGFLPIDTDSSTTLDGNTTNINWDLSDVIDNLSRVLTMRAGIEFDRWGLQTGINSTSFNTRESSSQWVTSDMSVIDKVTGVPSTGRLTMKGDVDADIHLDQTLIDIAVRYRAGMVQRPKMPKGSSSFVGFAGARIVDGSISADVDVKLAATYEDPKLVTKRSGTKRLTESWSRTWVQPLVGMNATYALTPELQAFVYLDAAGFGLTGRKDLSGTAQAGLAYAVGNSTQISLSYKYFGLTYEPANNRNGYETTAHGPNLGLRFLFN